MQEFNLGLLIEPEIREKYSFSEEELLPFQKKLQLLVQYADANTQLTETAFSRTCRGADRRSKGVDSIISTIRGCSKSLYELKLCSDFIYSEYGERDFKYLQYWQLKLETLARHSITDGVREDCRKLLNKFCELGIDKDIDDLFKRDFVGEMERDLKSNESYISTPEI